MKKIILKKGLLELDLEMKSRNQTLMRGNLNNDGTLITNNVVVLN